MTVLSLRWTGGPSCCLGGMLWVLFWGLNWRSEWWSEFARHGLRLGQRLSPVLRLRNFGYPFALTNPLDIPAPCIKHRRTPAPASLHQLVTSPVILIATRTTTTQYYKYYIFLLPREDSRLGFTCVPLISVPRPLRSSLTASTNYLRFDSRSQWGALRGFPALNDYIGQVNAPRGLQNRVLDVSSHRKEPG
jgi:hypothetical protein